MPTTLLETMESRPAYRGLYGCGLEGLRCGRLETLTRASGLEFPLRISGLRLRRGLGSDLDTGLTLPLTCHKDTAVDIREVL